MIPNLAIVHLRNPHWRGFRLWIPLILLWIPLLLLSPLLLLVAFGLCLAGRVSTLKAITALWAILCALPGTDVRVHSGANQVLVRIL